MNYCNKVKLHKGQLEKIIEPSVKRKRPVYARRYDKMIFQPTLNVAKLGKNLFGNIWMKCSTLPIYSPDCVF